MKIGIVGIGAVGGYYGALLAKAGFDVTFVGTERSVAALKKSGLRVKSDCMSDFDIKQPKASHAFEAIADADFVLFCLKSYNTEVVANELKKRISKDAVIVSLQNGIENEKLLSDIFGAERVIGSVVYVCASSPEPGLIQHTAYGDLVIGELDKTISDRILKLQKVLKDSHIGAKVTDNIYYELWKKLLLNSAYNGFTALIGHPLNGFKDNPEGRKAFYSTLKEGQKVAKADGVEISDEDIDKSMTVLENITNFKSSTLQDVENGKPLELDALQGAIIKVAEKYNIETPLNNLLYGLIKLKMESSVS